ncbi:MAG: hypothetical protein CUN56_04750, partial [Phototrophicales bacterium]
SRRAAVPPARDRWSGRAEDEADLTTVVCEYAEQYPHYGYCLITSLLRANGYDVNHKRIECIWRQGGLQQPKRKAYNRRYGKGAMLNNAQLPSIMSGAMTSLRIIPKTDSEYVF